MSNQTADEQEAEGIRALVEWARVGGYVLNGYHERIAIRHGVSVDGVVISRPIPLHPRVRQHGVAG